MATKIDFVTSSLHNADVWQAKEQPAWESRCLSSALMSLLSIAVEQNETKDSAVAWLLQHDSLSLLKRYEDSIQFVVQDVEMKRMPASVIGGNYEFMTFAHVAWTLSGFSVGERLVEIAKRDDVLEISTPFWRLYAAGLDALVHRAAFTLEAFPARGQERYWMPYLQLIQRATTGADLSDAIQLVNEAFAKRNLDMRINDDNYGTEGTGDHPVTWNYRLDGLLNYCEYNRLLFG